MTTDHQTLKDIKDARARQTDRLAASKIWTKIDQARGNAEASSRRWPFELLQNACDAGKRSGTEGITVSFMRVANDDEKHEFVFAHDGAPFHADDITALLGGSSSKDRESEFTTGRFGSGFLSTHVLSTSIQVEGLLVRSDEALRWFSVRLERGGDEASILENIKACDQQFGEARPIAKIQEASNSARFVYRVADPTPMNSGFSACSSALPVLFSTCPELRQVNFGTEEQWTVDAAHSDPRPRAVDGGWLLERRVAVAGESPREIRTLRFSLKQDMRRAVIVALERVGDAAWQVLGPGPAASKVYRKFPIRQLVALPLNFAIDAAFDVTEERENILLDGDAGDRAQAFAEAALSALPVALRHLHAEGVEGLHLLASLAPPSGLYGLEKSGEFWKAQLRRAAVLISTLELIPTAYGLRSVFDRDGEAPIAFPLPARTVGPPPWPLPFDAIHSLITEVHELLPPTAPVAESWTKVVLGWKSLGLAPAIYDLEQLAICIRSKAKTLEQLDTLVASPHWLPAFLDLVGVSWAAEATDATGLVEGLLPDQTGRLRSVKELRTDDGVPEPLKDIAERLGLPLRSELVHPRVGKASPEVWPSLPSVIDKVTKDAQTPEDTVQRLLETLKKTLPTGKKVHATDEPNVLSAVLLLAWLAEEGGFEDGFRVAEEVPLVTRDGSITRPTVGKALMAPPSHWAEEAREFIDVYTSGRVLDDRYDATEGLVRALVDWGFAHPDPFLPKGRGTRIRSEKLKSMVREKVESETLSVERLSFATIAELDDAVLNAVGEDPNRAKRVLEMALRYVAPLDTSWQQWQELPRVGGDDPLHVRAARWPSDLLGRAWIPRIGEGDDGGTIRVHPSPDVLKQLIEPAWLQDNPQAVTLLTDFFELDPLDLRLLAFDATSEQGQRLRGSLAKLLDITNADVDLLEMVTREAKRLSDNQVTLDQWREFGLAVQACVEDELRRDELKVQIEDYGKDFVVTLRTPASGPESDPVIDDLGHELEVGEWFVEVKATTGTEVSLTPTQARTAGEFSDRWVLCVVPLCKVDLLLTRDELVERVRSKARFVIGVGDETRGTVGLIDDAASRPIGIKNEKALRYTVKSVQWETGMSPEDWVQSILGGDTDPS